MNGVRRDWNVMGGMLAGLLIGACLMLLIRELVLRVQDAVRNADADKPHSEPAVERAQGVVTREIPVDGQILRIDANGLHAYEVTHERTGKTVVLLYMGTFYGSGLTTMDLPHETQKEKNADE